MRTFVDFTGLTAWEIFWRLLLLSNSFLFAGFFFAGGDPTFRTVGSVAGTLLTASVVLLDAHRARIRYAPLWAAVSAIPFLGWIAYARCRSMGVRTGPVGREGALWRALDPFRRERVTLWTKLSREECSTRLRALRVSALSPGTWFAPQQQRPITGSVSEKGFSIKRHHFMTRPGGLTRARGRYAHGGPATRIDVEIGLARWEAVIFLIMFAVMTLGSVAAALATAARASPSAPPAAFWLLGPIILITATSWSARSRATTTYSFVSS
jgi:hypothetical protein